MAWRLGKHGVIAQTALSEAKTVVGQRVSGGRLQVRKAGAPEDIVGVLIVQ